MWTNKVNTFENCLLSLATQRAYVPYILHKTITLATFKWPSTFYSKCYLQWYSWICFSSHFLAAGQLYRAEQEPWLAEKYSILLENNSTKLSHLSATGSSHNW